MTPKAHREIGGDFHLALSVFNWRDRAAEKWIPGTDPAVWLCSGRHVLRYISNELGLQPGDEVLLPAYLCPSVVEPFAGSAAAVRFYGVDSALRAAFKDIQKAVSPRTRALVLIHYFGFPQDDCISRMVKAMDSRIVVIEDCVQSPFSTAKDGGRLGEHADYTVFSYRKMLPVPDGAALVSNRKRCLHAKVSGPQLGFLAWQLAGMTLKSAYLITSYAPLKQWFRRCLTRADRNLCQDARVARISLVSRWLLSFTAVDEIRRRRRENFLYLLSRFAAAPDEYAVRPLIVRLPDGVCPLGFPVTAADRDVVRRRLIAHGVYPPVHWTLPEEVDRNEFPEMHWLSQHILTLPIDQRYGSADMERMLSVLQLDARHE